MTFLTDSGARGLLRGRCESIRVGENGLPGPLDGGVVVCARLASASGEVNNKQRRESIDWSHSPTGEDAAATSRCSAFLSQVVLEKCSLEPGHASETF